MPDRSNPAFLIWRDAARCGVVRTDTATTAVAAARARRGDIDGRGGVEGLTGRGLG